jgi:hypothetical protein
LAAAAVAAAFLAAALAAGFFGARLVGFLVVMRLWLLALGWEGTS